MVRRAICVAVLSEENQQLLPLIPCGTTPGGCQILPTFPGKTALAGNVFYVSLISAVLGYNFA